MNECCLYHLIQKIMTNHVLKLRSYARIRDSLHHWLEVVPGMVAWSCLILLYSSTLGKLIERWVEAADMMAWSYLRPYSFILGEVDCMLG
jgi:hypothetical protein